MKKLKNKIILLLALTVLLFVSCANGAKDAKPDDGRLSVVTTNFALYDFARSVCGDEADVIMLLPVGTDSHDFEATLGDIDKIASSDLFIHTGGESEDWVDDVFATLDSMGMTVNSICAADEVETYTEKELEGMQEEDEHDHHHEDEASIDEHVWTSIPNAVKIIEKIRGEVAKLDPDIADDVKNNSESYISELNSIDGEIEECVKSAKRNILVFADRFPFRYFAERYSLECYAAFSGCTSNTEPTLATINFLIDKVREKNIPDVLTTELSDRKCAEAVAGETGCGILQLDSAHNVTKEEFDAGVTYADLMRENLEVLKIVLN